MLQRVQILIDPKTKKDLEDVSKSTGRSMSMVVRSILGKGLKKEKKKAKKKMSGVDFLLKLAEGAVKGPGDSEYDKYAYNL
ncbi:hypothetical protein IID22_04520 [Patescibacteria group bacterium]|nr:hypothetical protein [Patescibacteria group bacterium]